MFHPTVSRTGYACFRILSLYYRAMKGSSLFIYMHQRKGQFTRVITLPTAKFAVMRLSSFINHYLWRFHIHLASTDILVNVDFHVQVVWGRISMVDAERRLLANALRDPANQQFVLLSERCFLDVHQTFLIHHFQVCLNHLSVNGFAVVYHFEVLSTCTIT